MLTIVTSLVMTAMRLLLPACEYEDVSNCYWSASEQGNGQGMDFFTLNGNVYTAENADNWFPTDLTK